MHGAELGRREVSLSVVSRQHRSPRSAERGSAIQTWTASSAHGLSLLWSALPFCCHTGSLNVSRLIGCADTRSRCSVPHLRFFEQAVSRRRIMGTLPGARAPWPVSFRSQTCGRSCSLAEVNLRHMCRVEHLRGSRDGLAAAHSAQCPIYTGELRREVGMEVATYLFLQSHTRLPCQRLGRHSSFLLLLSCHARPP
eukprot:358588-Rhodomonas_salina.2